MNKLIVVLGTGMMVLVGLFGYKIYDVQKQDDVIAQLQTNSQSLEQKISLVEQNAKYYEGEQGKIAQEIASCDNWAIVQANQELDAAAEKAKQNFQPPAPEGYAMLLINALEDQYSISDYKKYYSDCLERNNIYITGMYLSVE